VLIIENARPSKLNDAEAFAAALYIVGLKEEVKHTNAAVPNSHILDNRLII
jgi:ribosome biogenesis protein Tsr3